MSDDRGRKISGEQAPVTETSSRPDERFKAAVVGTRTSTLIIRLFDHQGLHPGRLCPWCSVMADVIDTRTPHRG